MTTQNGDKVKNEPGQHVMTLNSECKPKTLNSYHLSAILRTTRGSENLASEHLVELMKECVLKSELSPQAEVCTTFETQGVSAVVVLKESHIAVHLWPELQFATVDIHVCDFSQDNRSKAERLASLIGEKLADEPSLAEWSRHTLSK